ncbi:MAG: hypothetical protein O7C01_07460 [Actinobacteria bacterium]|nr:hypothetical protein [Actinomycetota bacterium]
MLGSSFRGHVLTTADVLEDYILLLRDADRGDEAGPLEMRAQAIRTLVEALEHNWTWELRYTGQKSRNTVSGEFQRTDHIFDVRIRTAMRIRDLGRDWLSVMVPI